MQSGRNPIVEAVGFDGYNSCGTGDKAATLGVNCGMSTGRNGIVQKVYYARRNGDGEVVPTLTGDHENRVTDYTAICLQGNGIDRADTAGCNGKGWKEDASHTLNTIDRHAVAYGIGRDAFNSGTNAKFGMSIEEEVQPPMTARGAAAVAYRYIVRRLTPTECARLQGFPDNWGHPTHLDEFASDEQFGFWLGVRQAYDAINGHAEKWYTREQMLKWYNGLHTDSSEYKMWGNGICLANALYVMQGIAKSS